MSGGDYESFHEAQGFNDHVDLRQTRRRQLERILDKESEPGHWLWKGRVNLWGTPTVLNAENEYVNACCIVYSLWRNRSMVPGQKRRCEHERCVNPDCFEGRRAAPAKPLAEPREPKPKAARTSDRVPMPVEQSRGRAGKELCHRGHRMSETRRRTPQGIPYCGECSKVKAKERWAKKKEAGDG